MTNEAQQAASDAWRESVEPARQSIGEQLSNISYEGNCVSVVNGADINSIAEAYCILREGVDPTIDPSITQQASVKVKNTLFVNFLEAHCWRSWYKFEILKCNVASCKACSKVQMPHILWNEISSCPSFVPFPTCIPGNSSNVVKYKSYNETKDKVTSPDHMPSVKPALNPSEATKKTYKVLAKGTRTEMSLWCTSETAFLD